MGVSELEESSMLLDEKLLRFMDQLESLEEKRATLNSLIEQGWFSMSKARYSMGNKHVSPLQYASEMEPLVCVHAKTLDSGVVDFCTEREKQKCCNEVGKDNGSIEDIGPQEEGVRRRIKSKKDMTEKEGSEETSSEKASDVNPVRKSEQNPQQDPLRWFGILVPQSLKHAQSSFKQEHPLFPSPVNNLKWYKVIELSAEIATLQIAVLNSRQELKHGMKDKHILLQEASANQLESTK